MNTFKVQNQAKSGGKNQNLEPGVKSGGKNLEEGFG